MWVRLFLYIFPKENTYKPKIIVSFLLVSREWKKVILKGNLSFNKKW